MALDAGSVFATLGGRFNPAGFVAFDGAMKKSKAGADAMASGLVVAGKKGHQALDGMAMASARTSRAMSVMSKGAVFAAGAGVAVLGVAMAKSVVKAMTFEKQMKSLGAVSSASARQMKAFEKQALALGASTGMGATKAAQALTELAKGGVAAKDMGAALRGTLALAAAGELEVAEASTITANALNLFALRGADATHVADALAQAANATTADVGDFGMALSQGGAAAKQAGLSFDQTVVALEALALAGVKNSDAGTSLKTALIQLIKPTEKQAEAGKAVGLSFVDQAGKMKSVADISRMLRDRTEGMTKAQRTALFATLAGTDGFRTLAALYDTGPAKLEKLAAAHKRQGDAADVADKKMSGAAGSMQKLKAAFESAQIIVGKELLPIIAEEADKAAKKLQQLAESGDLEKFGKDAAKFAKDAATVTKDVARGAADTGGFLKDSAEGFVEVHKELFNAAKDVADMFTLGLLPDKAPKFELKLTADVKDGIRNLGTFKGVLARLPKTTQWKIEASDGEAKAKLVDLVARLRKLRGERTVARIIGDSASAEQAARRVKAELASIHDKTVTFTLRRSEIISKSFRDRAPGAGHAAGHKTSGPEIALIGEGAGPEYVIPTEPRYRGRAIGLLMQAAEDLGIAGYKSGTKKKGKGGKPGPAKRKVPAKIAEGGVPFDDVEDRYQDAKQRYQDAGRDLSRAREAVNKAEHRLDRVPKGKGHDRTRANARDALRQAQKELTKAKGHRDRLQPTFEQRKAEYDAAKRTDDKAKALQSEINVLRDEMELADRGNDGRTFDAKKKLRGDKLRDLGRLLQRARDLANPNSEHARDLNELLSGNAVAVSDNEALADAAADPPPAAPSFTKDEQGRLDKLGADLALAELTKPTDDDKSVLEQILAVQEGALQRVKATGDSGAIKDVAEAVKGTRDRIEGLAGSTSQDQDLQAQLAQANERARVATESQQLAEAALTVFGPAGGAGGGGRSAAGGVTQNIYTLHPGDPRTLTAITEAAAAGASHQGSPANPRTSVGY